MDSNIFSEAQRLLKQLYGEDASFRDEQYEAIEAALTKHRTLVIQRTGWGKSLIYFLCTKMLRSQGKGVTFVVSPLLALMQNQQEAAERLGLACAKLNNRTREQWDEILDDMHSGRLDLVFVTPETLFNDEIQVRLPQITIGLFVIDEAHCISDWGHDFRLEYGRLREIIHQLPANVPILATTATANKRVREDLQEQLGEDVYVSRGPLTRKSLRLQVLPLESQTERYAWILENLKDREGLENSSPLQGSGIIYCLTKRDCDNLAEFLQSRGIRAVSYHSGLNDADNQVTEERFRNNKIKAIVATIKLGMGYDKDDIAFVIHFQMTSSIVSYYQQIGRAGRQIDQANVFLMSGKEDERIIEYFIESAFPTQKEADTIMKHIKDQEGGMTLSMLASDLNIREERLEKAIQFLMNDGYVYKEVQKKTAARYYATLNPYQYQGEKYQQIKAIRRQEMEQMKNLVHTRECLSKYIVRHLDDETARDCGHCVNCTGAEILPGRPSLKAIVETQSYMKKLVLTIKPRKRWPGGVMPKVTIAAKHQNQPGLCLSRYGEPGYGQMVRKGKYSREARFSEDLVERSVQVLKPFVQEHGIEAITFVPSLRSGLVEDFCERLAGQLDIPLLPLLRKSEAPKQKDMENNFHQCRNALDSFSVEEGAQIPDRVLLVDDVVDSKWTLTACGYRLLERSGGCREVYPFALADRGHGG